METANNKKTAKKGSKVIRIVIISAVVIVGLFFATKAIIHSANFENSDNAQIDGDIIPLRVNTSGHIIDLRFEENQQVKKGDTLAIMDTVDIKAKFHQAEARLESAMLGVQANQTGKQSAAYNTRAASENISSARAKLTQARNDFERIEAMYKKGAATPQAYDAAKSGLDMANAQYNALSAQRATAGTQITAQEYQIQMAEAMVKEAKAQLVSARYLLENCFIIAPSDGIISKKSVEVGQLCLPGTAVGMLIDIDNIWVTANLKETQLDKVSLGAEVNISIDAYPDIEITGKVESLAGATGPKFSLLPADNATGNFVKVTQRVPVKIAITNIENEKNQQLVPGMNVVVDIKASK